MTSSIRLLTIATASIALAALVAGIAYVGWPQADVDLAGSWRLDRAAPLAAGAGVEPLPADLDSRPAGDFELVVGPAGRAAISAGLLERLGLERRPGRGIEGSLERTGRGIALELVDQGERLRVPVEVEDADHLVVTGLRFERSDRRAVNP